MGPDRIKPMPPGYTATIWPMSEEAKERVRKGFEEVYSGNWKRPSGTGVIIGRRLP